MDTALEYSFRLGIPFLPQTPIRNPWEFMIPQALAGLPGLEVEKDGETSLNLEIWESQSHLLNEKLNRFLGNASEPPLPGSPQGTKEVDPAFFEPAASISSCWEPFLWELQERNHQVAKIQIAGPMTAQWALRLKGEGTSFPAELSTQIFKLVLARSVAMVRRLRSLGIRPLIFLDEPGFFALSLDQPRHLLCLQELKLLIQSLKKEGAWVGVHCCSNTQWSSVLKLGMDLLSMDTALSLQTALGIDEDPSEVPLVRKSMQEFLNSGGRLSLGIIPTTRTAVLRSLSADLLVDELKSTLNRAWPEPSPWSEKILKESLLTPACGMALQSISDSEWILEKLMEVRQILRRS